MSLYGENIVTNGTMDSSASWRLNPGNVSVWNGSTVVFIGTLIQDMTFVAGQTYRVSYDVLATTQPGSTQVQLGGTSYIDTVSAESRIGTTYGVDIVAGSSTDTLAISHSAGLATDNVTATEVFDFNNGDYIGIYYDIDDAGWVYAGEMDVTDSYKEQPFYINKTGKRIKFKFVGRGGNFQIRELNIMEPGIEDDR